MSIINDNISFPNIDGLSVYISGVEIFPRNTEFQKEPLFFEKITINEDMFAETVSGTVEFIDSTPNLEFSNRLSVGSSVVITMYGARFEFVVSDFNIVSDLAAKKMSGPGQPIKFIVRFASKLFLEDNFNVNLQQDFIGKISGSSDYGNVPEVDLPPGPPLGDGFVQYLYSLTGETKPLYADDTFNDIWFRHDPTFYPWSKIGNTSKFSQIMNYLVEYACYGPNFNAVNFFFWEDLFGWNFKCLETLSRQGSSGLFTPSLDENNAHAIVYFEVINSITPTKLRNEGAFFSEYVRVKPNWGNPYNSDSDVNADLTKTLYTYTYDLSWSTISGNPVRYFGGDSNTTRISDTSYGYHSIAYNKQSTQWWNFYDNYNEYSGDRSILIQPDRMETTYWKSQFDFCELPASWLARIYYDIKWPLVEARKQYAQAKRAKKEWDIFKKRACCVRDTPETFFAVLTGAQKIYGSDGSLTTENGDTIKNDAGGIWAYEWSEVEFWPRDLTEKILNNPAYQIIEFEDNSFPFVFVKPKGAAQGIAPPEPNIDEFPDTRAYNLNEILNSQVAEEFEIPGYRTIAMNPGISTPLGLTAENKSDFSSYPANFSMMPVGKFRITTDVCPVPFKDTGEYAPTDAFYFGGRIVQMYRIPKQTLSGIKTIQNASSDIFTQKTSVPTDNIYIFDTENAHDGLCADCGEEE
jgi:hypothetical protein